MFLQRIWVFSIPLRNAVLLSDFLEYLSPSKADCHPTSQRIVCLLSNPVPLIKKASIWPDTALNLPNTVNTSKDNFFNNNFNIIHTR